MKNIKVELLHYTPLWVCSDAIRTCWDSGNLSDTGLKSKMHDVLGKKDADLIDRVANKFKHESVKNHIQYNFAIKGISTKTLLALTRHDVGVEFSVQSSRYTCKKSEMKFTKTKNENINIALDKIIEIINETVKSGGDCDDIAMLLPQAYQYNLACSFSLQALQHFLSLRLKKDAHWDIRDLANELASAIPEDHLYLFDEIIKNVPKEETHSTQPTYPSGFVPMGGY